ncbi:imelysin family protein [Pseudoalteromonas luteoviolacea]|uniref:Imelysin-like domain-containing protein n=1 Tax=Pseudoalteromonas luteoviolacea S4060-1 TaxID=1365257 RepID=A0A167KMM5_9GAMM|nr:imelysin family protein [Pseudoalteromonas luteoviolacea]KZN63007.1 hypothetical protein N478_25045 [Pseudoalteromonas luteoviolacea S4060-1]
MKTIKHFALTLVCTAVLAGCNGDDGKDGAQGAQGVQGEQGTTGQQGAQGPQGEQGLDGVVRYAVAKDVVMTNAQHAYAVYSDSLQTAKMLKEKIDAFVALPSDENFTAAKQAWLEAREPYGQSEVYRFRDGPIDDLTTNDAGQPVLVKEEGPEGAINAWPLAEAMIDYTIDMDGLQARGDDAIYSAGGNIIADAAAFPNITAELIKNQFEVNDEEANVSSGYHAIEFLLWGQDLNQDGTYTQARDFTAGHRPVTDFYTTTNTQTLPTANTCTSGENGSADTVCERRGMYLKAAAELLVADLQGVVDAWTPGSGFHYIDYTKEENANANLAAMLESMGRLGHGELAGERMSVAVRTDSQEDEHSCFSDNTHRDILLNAQGIENHYLGTYTRTNEEVLKGAGVHDLLMSAGHKELAGELQTAIDATMAAVRVIDDNAKNNGISFDVQIQTEKHQLEVRAAMTALKDQTAVVQKVIDTLGLETESLTDDTEEQF